MNKKTCFVAATLAMLIAWALPVFAEEPIKVSVCQLLEEPSRYNHRLIEINGAVSRGFEDFTLSDRRCKSRDTIWLELGGTQGSEVVYCCGVSADAKRKSALVVEGVETRLVVDAMFEKFQKTTMPQRGYGKAEVTLVGRYFSGRKQTLPGGTFWVGYGHMGLATLLVIEQVKQVRSE
jgi:hypothetical protein